jgi:hypothetical protein
MGTTLRPAPGVRTSEVARGVPAEPVRGAARASIAPDVPWTPAARVAALPPGPELTFVPLSPVELAEAREAFALLGLMRAQETEFEARLGEAGVWADLSAGKGEPRLLTLRAAGRAATLLPRLAQLVDRRVYEHDRRGEPLGRTVGELLVADEPAPELSLGSLRLRHLPATATGVTFDGMDAAAARRAGVLVFHEIDGDDVVAEVAPSSRGVILLAGEILGGGRVDRVVRRTVWMPPSPTGSRQRIPCVRVSTVRETRGEVVPTGFVAGPSVRAALARGARAREVMDLVRTLRIDEEGVDHSLLDLYVRLAPATRTSLPFFAGAIVTDARGNLLGAERLGMAAPAAGPFLERLLVGYAVESDARVLRAAAGTRSSAAAVTGPAVDVLTRLRDADGLRIREESEGVRVATVRDPVTGTVSVAHLVDADALQISVLAD